VGGGCLHGVARPAGPGAPLVVRGETCFELLVNRALVDHWTQGGAHLVTVGWLARWREMLERWGLDRETASALFRDGANRLLLLDTGVDPEAGERLRGLAAWVGLPWEAVPVGLDHYRLTLEEAAQRVRGAQGELAALRRRVADGEAVFDFVTRLAGARDESEVVGRLLDLVGSLLAPQRILYCPVEGDTVGPARLLPDGSPEPELEREVRALRGDAALAASGRSILFRVADERETFGLGVADGLAFPDYRERYLELVRTLMRAAAVVVGSARALARAARAEAAQRRAREEVERGLSEALESVRTLRGLLPICASCKRIRDEGGSWVQIETYVSARSEAKFSHGVCPDCFAKLYPEFGSG
jgi:hypothetical protein